MNSELVVKINPAEIFQAQNKGKDFIINPNAEDAIIRLLEIQKEVDGAVDWLKSKIERQVLEFNPNLSAIKGSKVKINYSASGAKYKDNSEVKFHSSKFWKKKTTWTPDSKAIDAHRAKYYRLPVGISEVERKKTIRITVSEVTNE